MVKKSFNIFYYSLLLFTIVPFFLSTLIDRIQFVRTGIQLQPNPQPFFSPVGVPDIDGTNSINDRTTALGVDFSQVYFSAKALRYGESIYFPISAQFRDRLGRLNGYPPITHWLYLPLTNLSYPDALIVHNLASFLFFIFLQAIILKIEGAIKYFWKVSILTTMLYFFTSIGLTHFERGQFDLIAAAAFMWPVIVFSTEKMAYIYAILFGFIASIKWTPMPYIGTFGAFALLSVQSRKRWAVILSLFIFILSFILFWPQMKEYFLTLQSVEINFTDGIGLSFSRLMPKPLARYLIIITSIILAMFFWKLSTKENRSKLFLAISFPLAFVLALQAMGFGMISNEYRSVTLLGLMIPFILWLEKGGVAERLQNDTAFVFAFFLAFVFRNFNPIELIIDSRQMALVYLIFSLLGGIFCIGLMLQSRSKLVVRAS